MSKLYSSIISIVLGFTVAAVTLILVGLYPYDFFASLLKGLTGYDILYGTFNIKYVGTLFVTVVPLILTGLSVGFAFKTGLFNIGAEGQFIMGALFATIAALYFPLPPVILPIVAIAFAGIGGALWGAIPGILKAWRGLHEVVVCIMLNYVALYTSNIIIKSVDGYANNKTPEFSSNASITSEWLQNLMPGSKLNFGFIIAIMALIIYAFVINKTAFGYKLKVIGFNKDAAKYSGINVKLGMVQAMSISGAFAGIAGAIVTLGTFGFGRMLPGFENYGFDGLSVALVGGSTAIGIFFASILFGTLNVSISTMQLNGIPGQLSVFVSGLIVYFIALSFVTDEKLERRRIKKEAAKERKQSKLSKEEL